MWISVKERLPEIGSRVLVDEGNGYIEICQFRIDSYYSKRKPSFIDEQGEQPSVVKPKYWMPLPKPKTEKK